MDYRNHTARSWLSDASLFVLLAMVIVPSFGADTVPQDAVRAAYLYRFAGYIDWPAQDAALPDFTIDIMGSPGTADELRRLLAKHSIKDKQAQVREIASLQDLGDAHILYVGTGYADMIRGLAPRPGRPAILVVTDEDGALAAGSVINLIQVERNIRFEVSIAAAQRWGLKISSELLSVAVRVQAPHPQSAVMCPRAVPDAMSIVQCRRVRESLG